MKLSIIIPCYNEVYTIEAVVNAIRSRCDLNKELIIVDDCSNDGTKEILKRKLEGAVEKIIYQDLNQGKGAAVRAGLYYATGDIVVIQDADLEYDPGDIARLVQPIRDGKADAVYGSRFVGSESKRVLFFWHMIGNKFLTLLSNMLTNLNLTDMECGYKAVRKEVIRSMQFEEDRYGFEPEITAKLGKGKYRIYEVGISYSGRTYEEGKKVTWKDGISAIRCIIQYNLFRK